MDWIYSFWGFALGMVLSLAAAAVAWVLYGRRLNLYLVSGDSPISDQALIPVTAENGLRSRRENINLTLTDYAGGTHALQIGFGLFVRFYLLPGPHSAGTKLGRKPLEGDKYYPIRSGAKLTVGDREYTLVVARANSHSELMRKFV